MKNGLLTLSWSLAVTMLLSSSSYGSDGSFAGAVPEPIGHSQEMVGQLRIRFPEGMIKDAKVEAFKVACKPALSGYSGWADNSTIWTYDFKSTSLGSEDGGGTEYMVDGSKCEVTQLIDVKSVIGKIWKAGSIHYTVSVAGPNVTDVIPARGFKGLLREVDPVLFITFDGPVDSARFFAEQSGYLSYLSSNAPSEKIVLAPVPQDKAEKLFEYFAATSYTGVEFNDRRWLLATVRQNLIPGAELNLTIEKQASADNPELRAEKKHTQKFSVRSQFQAEVQCANQSAQPGLCLPRSPISVVLNGQVKWADIKDAYIEYLPYNSPDRKTVRSFAEIDPERKIAFWDNILIKLARYFPFLAKYNDTILDSFVFNVNIEPQTQATIVLPTGLTDIDGRLLASSNTEFHVRIGAIDEVIRVPQSLSFFERTVPNLHLPVGIVNQNQKITIRKTGTDGKIWTPVTNFETMIQVIRAYTARGSYRSTPTYTSPLEQLTIPSSLVEQQLTGAKNRPAVLQFPFAGDKPGAELVSGLYPLEVSSPSFEASRSDTKEGSYYNPKFVLAQVTDITVHIKKGATSSLVWVTRLSNAQPVAGARVEIYNCLGQRKAEFTTGATGLVSFPNQEWATECQKPENTYSSFFDPSQFFVAAKAGSDLALVHSSWTGSGSDPMSAPGVEWFYSNIQEGQPLFHAVVGVNLVKPGQQVPIELIARIPEARGFRALPPAQLPTKAVITSADDEETYYEFPLVWANGKASLNWNVPSDSSVRLGRYFISLKGAERTSYIEADIEVAEFKVPLMSGIVAFPKAELVRPDSIPVNASIRYANGVGAKKLAASVSYYFSATSIVNEQLPNFIFGTGPITTADESVDDGKSSLPNSTRPSMIPGLMTGDDGSLVKDIANENAGDGRTVAGVLKSVSRPQRLVVRVRYQDQSGEFQTLSQAKTIYNASTYVGLNVVAGPRANAQLQAAVIDVNMKNITALGDLDLKVIRIETKVIGEEIFGGLIKNTIERELQPVRWTENCAVRGKIVSCPVGALKEGSYAFQVTTKSSQQTSHALFKVDGSGRVYGPSDYYGFGDDEGQRQMPLALNKAGFRGGERAMVSFAPPFKTCQALVTIERADVLESFVVSQACEKGRVEVPVRAELAPNAFVSVYAITGRAQAEAPKVGEADFGRPTYRIGFANMKVNWGLFKSNVTVKTNKATYKPGEKVEVAVAVKAESGRLKGGTVTLVAIEEKILELKKNSTYAILDALMQMRGDSVETVTALERIETVTGTNTDIGVSKRNGGDDGGDGGNKITDFKRKLFNALVVFKAGIPVQNGVAKFTFNTNDSLTRFKIFAIAVDDSQKFGMGSVTYLSEQDTQSYSNIPSVATTGDKYPLRVTVQNNTSKNGKYKAEIVVVIKDRNGKVIGTKTLTKDASIAKARSVAINVGEMTVDENAARIEYTINVYDENGRLVDSQQPDAQVVSPAVPLAIRDSLIAQTENGALTKLLEKDASALPGKGKIQVSASKSLVLSALSQISQRMEQDRFADFFIESRFNKALLHSTEAKPEAVKAVLTALLGFTDRHGFIKYHPSAARGSVWLTASIINSLQLEPWALKHLPVALNEKLKNAVQAVLSKSVAPEYIGITPMAWMRAQVLMGRAAFALGDDALIAEAKALNLKITRELAQNPEIFGSPVERWSNIDLLERWLLEVYAAPENALNSLVLKQITSGARMVYSGNMAQLKGSPFADGFLYSDETIESARLLLGVAQLGGDKSLARNLAAGLANANLKAWYCQGTLMSVAQSLKGFARAYEAETVTGAATITVPESQATVTVNLDQKVAGGLTTEWLESKAKVQVTHSGRGQPWVSIQALTAVPLESARSQGIVVEKSIRNLTRDSGFQAGDVIEVTLHLLSNATVGHVAMLDPIPAGSNILADAYGSFSSGQKSYSGYKLYFETLYAGKSTVQYQYQLNNPGTFNMAPTRAEGLHMPSIFGEIPNATMTVQ